MTLREFPGALVLGVLASLMAHTALFGGDHAMGGGYHAALLQLAIVGSVGLLVFYGLLAWSGSRNAADGSVLAARITPRLPGFFALCASTTLWYAVAERIEPEHAAHAPLLGTMVALAAAAWVVLALTRALVRLLASAVIAIARTRWAPRVLFLVERSPVRLIVRRSPIHRRRFARPPPVAHICA